MDEGGVWVTGLGTIIHETMQESILKRFPSAKFELSSEFLGYTEDYGEAGFVSGSCDALIGTNDVGLHYGGTHVLWELKSMGTFAFDKQVGWNRMRGAWKAEGGSGPAKKAIVQAGLNALGIERENPKITIESLVMSSVTFEALSKQKAESMGVDGVNRFMAEWVIPREEWEPLVNAELDRMSSIDYTIKAGVLPERYALDDEGQHIELNPGGRDWQCVYCSYRSACQEDGPGQVTIRKATNG